MGNGKWETGSGEWRVESGKYPQALVIKKFKKSLTAFVYLYPSHA